MIAFYGFVCFAVHQGRLNRLIITKSREKDNNQNEFGLESQQNTSRLIHRETFQGEGGEAEETDDRHLEDLHVGEDRDGVIPFGRRPEVPELPQEPADQSAYEKRRHALVIALGEIPEQAVRRVDQIDRPEEKDRPHPNERPEIPGRVNQRNRQTDETKREEGAQGRRRPGPRLSPAAPEPPKRQQQVRRHEEAGENRAERPEVTESPHPEILRQADVVPALHPVIVKLVNEPRDDRDGNQKTEFASARRQPGAPFEPEDNGVGQKDVSRPSHGCHVGGDHGIAREQKGLGRSEDGEADPTIKPQFIFLG